MATLSGSAFALAAVALALGPGAAAAAEPSAPPDSPAHAPDRVIVRYRPGVGSGERSRLRDAVGARSARALALSRTEVVRLPEGSSVARAVGALRRSPGVEFAQPDFAYRPEALPDDPLFGQQWGLRNTGQLIGGSTGTAGADIDAARAWDVTTGDDSLVVGVIDAGVNIDHADLAPNIFTNPGEIPGNGVDDDGNGFIDDVHGWDFVNHDPNVADDVDEHGTLVSSVIGARGGNGIGISGVAQRARILPLQTRTSDGFLLTSAIVNAVAYARDVGARVVNMSFGYFDTSTDIADRDAIRAAPNVLFSTSAGNFNGSAANNNDSTPHWPSQLTTTEPNVIASANTTNQDGLAPSSSYGLGSVDLGAPGSDITGAALQSALAEHFDGVASGALPAGWTTNGSWAATSETALSAANSLSDSPGGDYAAGSDTWAESPVFAVPAGASCYVHNARQRSTQNSGDVFTTEYSLDGGPFAAIDSRTGTATEWTTAAPGFATGSATSARIRFRVTAKADATTADGVHIDDVDVRCSGGNGYQVGTGTSFSAPMTTGAAALLLARDPSLSAAQVKSILRATVDPLDSLSVKTISGGRLNAARAVHTLVAPVASGGSAGSVTDTGAVLHGTVTPNGSPTTFHFDYRQAGALDWISTPETPAGEGAPAAVSANVGGLESDTAYEYRLVVAKPLRAGRSEVATFRTAVTGAEGPAQPPPQPVTPTPPAGSRDTVAPRITGLTVTPRVFRPVLGGLVIFSRIPRGAAIRFRVSEPATAAARILASTAGRRVGRSCVRPTRANRGARRCRRKVSPSSSSLGPVRGSVRRALSGRIRARALRPGVYTLEVTATDRAGNGSRPVRTTFRIARG